jgi:hypothetical protein
VRSDRRGEGELQVSRPPRSCQPLAADRRVEAREATRVSGLGLDSVDSAETIVQRGGLTTCPTRDEEYRKSDGVTDRASSRVGRPLTCVCIALADGWPRAIPQIFPCLVAI